MTGSQLLSVLVIALGLSMDCFAVALSGSIGLKSFKPVQVTRVALSFGLFQTVMPLLGWLAGQTVVGIIGAYDHWVAFILLAIIGGRMVWESFQKKEEETRAGTDFTRGLLLFTLSLATSIDALAVGLTFAFIKINIAAASGVIGIVAFLATVAGFLLGRRAGRLVGKRAETIGGIILFGIGLRILLTHIL